MQTAVVPFNDNVNKMSSHTGIYLIRLPCSQSYLSTTLLLLILGFDRLEYELHPTSANNCRRAELPTSCPDTISRY